MSNYIKNETIAEILNSYKSGGISREETDRQLLMLIELEERKPFNKMNPQKLAEYEWALYEFRTGKPLVTRKEEGLARLQEHLARTKYKPKTKSKILVMVTVLTLLGIGWLLVYLLLR